MLEFVPSLLKPDSFWSRTWRFLCTLDEAVHTSEMDILVAHVARLECELKELKSRAYAAASVPDRPPDAPEVSRGLRPSSARLVATFQ